MKKLLLSVVVFLMVAITAIAQERVITGTVTSAEDNKPLPGASVKVKGTKTGVSTGADGKYTLKAASNATLEFSSLGFAAQSKNVGTASSINVALASDAQSLGEVVVTGVGVATQKNAYLST